MKYLKETTDWRGSGINVPNHVYIFDKKDRWVGYITDSGWRYEFSEPFYFSKKGRTFKEVKYG